MNDGSPKEGEAATLLRKQIQIEQRIENLTGGSVVGFQHVTINQEVRERIDHELLSTRVLYSLARTFAEPLDFVNARRKLDEHRIVVLTGTPGNGRYHAAAHLLSVHGNITARKLSFSAGEPLDTSRLRIERETGWLLDLRHDEEYPSALDSAFREVEPHLHDLRSLLVVIGGGNVRFSIGSDAESWTHPMRPPPAEAIVRKRLEAEHPRVAAESYLTHDEVRLRLATATTAEAVRWADAIVKVASGHADENESASLDSEQLLARRITTLIKIRTSWRDDLLEIHRKADSRVRNFMLAAAVLDGRPADEVFRAASDLAVALGEPRPQADGQQGPGLIELTHIAEAELRTDERVTFVKLGYADAIIEYFWVDRQHIRKQFLRWVTDFPGSYRDSLAAQSVAERIAPYVLRWSARERSLSHAQDVLDGWAKNPAVRSVAEDLIVALSLDDDLTGLFGRKSLDWARQASPELKAVLAAACSGDFAGVRPSEAIYRIGVLAESDEPAVMEAVSTAVDRLWSKDQLRERLLDLVSRWCNHNDERRRRSGAALFLAVSKQAHFDNVQLNSRREFFEAGWRAALDLLPGIGSETLCIWLDDAVQSHDRRGVIVEILAAAVGGDWDRRSVGRRAVRLTKLLYKWQPSHPEDAEQKRARALLRDQIIEMAITRIPLPVLEEQVLPTPGPSGTSEDGSREAEWREIDHDSQASPPSI
jgi:hypothetical protein